MEIIKSVFEMQARALKLKLAGKKIGFVPTMGYLHEGHLSLLDYIRAECDILITSVFVNPTQFGPGEDWDKYPRDIARDEKLLAEKDCDILFYPAVEEIYPKGYATYIEVEGLTSQLCGKSRPTHFRGVITIVTKLFLITQCDIACFGQKDGQQAAVIRRMARDLNFPLEIAIAPIVRESDGLAISSRNVYLSPDERRRALCLKRALDMAEHLIAEGERVPHIIIDKMWDFINLVEGARIDYIQVVETEEMTPVPIIEGKVMIALAVWIGRTRLIDNVVVEV